MAHLSDLPEVLYRVRYGLFFCVALTVLYAAAVAVCWPMMPDHVYNHSSKAPALVSPMGQYVMYTLVILVSGPLLIISSDGRQRVTLSGLKTFRAHSVSVGAISFAWAAGMCVTLYDDITRSGAFMEPRVIVGLLIVVLMCIGVASLASIE